jgi:hypothetical protein
VRRALDGQVIERLQRNGGVLLVHAASTRPVKRFSAREGEAENASSDSSKYGIHHKSLVLAIERWAALGDEPSFHTAGFEFRTALLPFEAFDFGQQTSQLGGRRVLVSAK